MAFRGLKSMFKVIRHFILGSCLQRDPSPHNFNSDPSPSSPLPLRNIMYFSILSSNPIHLKKRIRFRDKKKNALDFKIKKIVIVSPKKNPKNFLNFYWKKWTFSPKIGMTHTEFKDVFPLRCRKNTFKFR